MIPPTDKMPDVRGAAQYIASSDSNGTINYLYPSVTQAHTLYIHYYYGLGIAGSGETPVARELQFNEDVVMYFEEESYPRLAVIINGTRYYFGWNAAQFTLRVASFSPIRSLPRMTQSTMDPLAPQSQLIINKMSLEQYEAIDHNRFEFYVVDDGIEYQTVHNKLAALSAAATHNEYPSAKAIYNLARGGCVARDATYVKY